MKKKRRIAIAVLLIILIPLALAQVYQKEQVNITNPFPQITVIYNEEVIISEATITRLSDGKEYEVSYSTMDDIQFMLTPEEYLYNDDYELVVTSTDQLGNPSTVIQPFNIEAPYMDIWVISPELGVAQTEVFDIEVGTEEDSVCRYSLVDIPPIEQFNYPFLFDIEEDTSHSILQANTENTFYLVEDSPDQNGKERTLFVKCQDEFGIVHPKSVYVAYDTSAPELDIKASPNPVIDSNDPFSELSIESSDRTICSYTKNGEYGEFPGFDLDNFSAYKKNHLMTLDFTDLALRPSPELFEEEIFDFTITCTNLAGLTTTSDLTVIVSFEDVFTILMNRPGQYTNKQDVYFEIETSIQTPGGCKYGETAPTSTFDIIQGNKIYASTLAGLEDGVHSYSVRCTSAFNDQTKDFSFTIDRDPPQNLTIDLNPACSLERITGTFDAEDEVSGISHYNFTISEGNEILKKGSTDSNFNEQLELEHGKTYRLNVVAFDKAGNYAEADASFEAKDPESIECDLTPPSTSATASLGGLGIDISIECQDSGSGCRQDFIYGVSEQEGDCNQSKNGKLEESIFLTIDQYVCWTVFDKNNNNASRTQFFQKDNITQPAHCQNGVLDEDETGIDCGGSCEGCEKGSFCMDDSDCITAWCDNGVCSTPSCSDGIRNGGEEGIDCGDVCDNDCPICGNGVKENTEQCDLGDSNGLGIGCDQDCRIECDISRPCPQGTNLCSDGTCSLNCYECDKTVSLCDGEPDGVCDSSEGCACIDCDREQDSCSAGLACALEITPYGSCCDFEGDGECSQLCRNVDPDCEDVTLPSCGNSVLDFGEECDLGEDNGQSLGCDDNCRIECGISQPCPEGTYLCEDGTCSLNCLLCEDEPGACNNNGACEEGEGCSCSDCDMQPDSCTSGLTCSLTDGSCCNAEEDGVCDFLCSYADPDCMFSCEYDLDCKAGYGCYEGACVQLRCEDGIKNFGETGIDCGGVCEPCEIGTGCEEDEDCRSGICEDGVCAESGSQTSDDLDGDGMPNEWEEMYNLNPTDPSDAQQDNDGDGFTNLEEYLNGTDPNNPDNGYQAPDKKGGLLQLILLIVGLLMIISGVVWLLMERQKKEDQPKPKEDPRLVSEKVSNPTEKTRSEEKKEQKLYDDKAYSDKNRKKAEERSKLISQFKSSDEKDGEKELKKLEPIKHEEKKHASSGSDEKEQKAESQKKASSGKKDSNLKKDQDLDEEDLEKDIFQELSEIGKDETAEEQKGKEAKDKKAEKKPEEEKEDAFSDLEKIGEKGLKKKEVPDNDKDADMSQDDIFKELAELTGQEHKDVKKDLDKEKLSKKDVMKVFANVTSKNQIDANVFKAILSQLLKKGKLSKQTVADVLFGFMESELLSKKEVADLMKELKISEK